MKKTKKELKTADNISKDNISSHEPNNLNNLNSIVENETKPSIDKNEINLLLNKEIELNKTVKDLKEEINKINLQQKQLMLATRLNTIKELEIQNKELIKYANQKIIKDLVNTLLNFQRALNFKTDNQEVKNFLVGFKFIYDELIKSLGNEGLKEITAKVGDKFDYLQHEAVEIVNNQIEDNNQIFKNNTIIEVIANGYKLYNRIISTIKVKIFQIVEEQEEKIKPIEKNIN